MELGGPADAAGMPFISVQLTDPRSGATRVLIRGAARASQTQLMAALKQQVRYVEHSLASVLACWLLAHAGTSLHSRCPLFYTYNSLSSTKFR